MKQDGEGAAYLLPRLSIKQERKGEGDGFFYADSISHFVDLAPDPAQGAAGQLLNV